MNLMITDMENMKIQVSYNKSADIFDVLINDESYYKLPYIYSQSDADDNNNDFL